VFLNNVVSGPLLLVKLQETIMKILNMTLPFTIIKHVYNLNKLNTFTSVRISTLYFIL